MANRRELEESFMLELRVFASLYGNSFPAQMQWARSVMPAEAAEHYMEAWWQGRRSAMQYLRWMASRLQNETGTNAAAWVDRCSSPAGLSLQEIERAGQRQDTVPAPTASVRSARTASFPRPGIAGRT
jgi:hypothetical protein